MRCGTAQADITPAAGSDMIGFVARTQPSLGIHDPLLARALFVEKDGRRLLWLNADALAFERTDAHSIKAGVFTRFGLDAHEVMVTATHTHSGGPTTILLECGEYDPAYVEKVRGTLLEIAGEAIRAAVPATPFFAEGRCDLGLDRRGFPSAHTDPRLPVIGWQGEDGRWLAVLASYGVHGVAMGPDNRHYSGDILGRAARTLSQQLTGEPIVLFANGACGNINPPNVSNDFGAMEGWGDSVAAAAEEALLRAAPLPDTIGSGRVETMIAAPGHLTEAGVNATIAAQLDGNERFMRAKNRWRGLLAGGNGRVEAPLDVQAVVIGNVAFIGFGAEVFSRIGEELGDHVYPVGYANGDAGYLCPGYAYEEGGYEPCVACLFYGTNPIPKGAYERAQSLARDLAVGLAVG